MNRSLVNLPEPTSKPSFEDCWSTVKKSVRYLAEATARFCPEDADDIYQLFMIDAWKSYGKWDPNKGAKFNTFAINRMTNHRKSILDQSISDREKGKTQSPIEDEVLFALIDSKAYQQESFEERILENIEANRVLDRIESTLRGVSGNSIQDQRAYDMFRMMRYEGKGTADCSRSLGITMTWTSQIFSKKIKKVGNEIANSSYNKAERIS